jgi:hypothetical protein
LAMHYEADAAMISPLSGTLVPLAQWTRKQFTSNLRKIGFRIICEHSRAPQSCELANTKALLILQS